MKTKIAILTVLLLASTSVEAMAQDHRRGREPQAARTDDRGPRSRAPDAPRAQRAPRAPDAPRADAERRRGGEGRGFRTERPAAAPERNEVIEGRRGPGGDRRSEADRGGARGDGGWNGGQRRGDQDHRGDRDRRGGDHDRRGSDHDRWRGDNRESHGRPRWEQHRYPPVYRSQQRFRGSFYRPPVGFYTRLWSYGDTLPRGWYGDSYLLTDWWAYDLPMPPPGFDWVRVGDDAVLIDRFSGRIVQVVRYLFW